MLKNYVVITHPKQLYGLSIHQLEETLSFPNNLSLSFDEFYVCAAAEDTPEYFELYNIDQDISVEIGNGGQPQRLESGYSFLQVPNDPTFQNICLPIACM